MDVPIDKKSPSLFNKSQKLEKKKDNYDRLSKRKEEDQRSIFGDGNASFDAEQIILSAENVYLTKVFPLFLIFIGVFLIIISYLIDVDSKVPFFLGLSVTLSAIVWHLLVLHKRNKERKKFFLKHRLT